MSAPLRLTSEQLRDLSHTLDGLTRLRLENAVTFDPHTYPEVGIGGSSVRISWDAETEQYVVDDRNGD